MENNNAKRRSTDLLSGPILLNLSRLAIPIMATGFVQTAYSLTDMAWIGLVGSRATAAVGAAGMFTWLASGLVTIPKMGGQIELAQSVGAGNEEHAGNYLRAALKLTIGLILIFSVLAVIFTPQMIGFIGLNDSTTILMAESYNRIACGLYIFQALNLTFTGIYTALGDSRTPFLANCVGLVGNMIFDPLLILGIGPFPELRVEGAAIATVGAQAVVTLIFILKRKQSDYAILRRIGLLSRVKGRYYIRITKMGLPAALQDTFYSFVGMMLTRMVSAFGDDIVAVQKVGANIEQIAWMTGQGFGAAVNAFIAQNFGAGRIDRVKGCYIAAVKLMIAWGIIATGILYFGSGPLYRIFLHEQELIPLGANYMRIIAYGELFVCIELMTNGALSGLGHTGICSLICMSLTGIRIPVGYFLSSTSLGVDGIWWAYTVTSIAKGVVYTAVILAILKKLMKRYRRSRELPA